MADSVEQAIVRRFDAVAATGTAAHFRYPTGDAGLEGLGYAPEMYTALPEEMRARFCGVGNVQRPALLTPGENVLDMGCGCGVDSLLAAAQVLPHAGSHRTDQVVGIDCSPGMIRFAQQHTIRLRVKNALFLNENATKLPLAAETIDCVLSNGVFNLIKDKQTALSELFRVLKSGGRLVIADQVRTVDAATEMRPESWAL